MKQITLHHEAETELQESVQFYEAAGEPEISSACIVQFTITLRIIREDPRRFPRVPKFPTVQKCRVRRFPYSIYYINRPDDVWVIAVAHGSRHPGFWTGRLK